MTNNNEPRKVSALQHLNSVNIRKRHPIVWCLVCISVLLSTGCNTRITVISNSAPNAAESAADASETTTGPTTELTPTQPPVDSPTATPLPTLAQETAILNPTAAVEPTATIEPTATATVLSRPTATPHPANAQADTPSIPAAIGEGRACILSSSGFFGCITETGQWKIYAESELPGSVFDFTFCGDGRMLVQSVRRLFLESGSGWEPVSLPEDVDPFNFACTDSNTIWVAEARRVWQQSDTGWISHESEQVMPSSDDWFHLKTAGDEVWVYVESGAVEALSHFNGSGWQETLVEEQWPDSLGFGYFDVDDSGVAWFSPDGAQEDAIYRFENGTWTPAYPNPFQMSNEISVDSSKDRLFRQIYQGIGLLDMQTLETQTWGPENSSLTETALTRSRGFDTDSGGRLWMATWGGGLYILDGSEWRNYRMENSPLADNDIEKVRLYGSVVELPAETPKMAGALVGAFTYQHQSLVNAMVEACNEEPGLLGFSGASPCADANFSVQTTTDADGAFRFNDLPAGNYYLFVQVEDLWIAMAELGFMAKKVANPGEMVDIGLTDVKLDSLVAPETPIPHIIAPDFSGLDELLEKTPQPSDSGNEAPSSRQM